MKSLNHARLFMTPWTAAYQAPLSMGFFQASVLEWGAIAFSVTQARGLQLIGSESLFLWFWCCRHWVYCWYLVNICWMAACLLILFSHFRLFGTPWTVASLHGILQARILERVAISFSRGSSWPRDRTCVSCIAGRFFTVWPTREASLLPYWF